MCVYRKIVLHFVAIAKNSKNCEHQNLTLSEKFLFKMTWIGAIVHALKTLKDFVVTSKVTETFLEDAIAALVYLINKISFVLWLRIFSRK